MIRHSILLSAGLLLTGFGSAQAEKLTLPIGNWGFSSNHGVECKQRILTIEPSRIIQRLDEGSARCAVKKIKKKLGVLWVDTKCNWDAGVPQGLRESPDEDDPDSFSIKIVGPAKILFNNTNYELCSALGVNP